jgi:hypothetical protein
MLGAIGIVLAAACMAIKQTTSNRRVIDEIIFFILKLVQATLATAITERFPFILGHVGKRLGFPKRFRRQ